MNDKFSKNMDFVHCLLTLERRRYQKEKEAGKLIFLWDQKIKSQSEVLLRENNKNNQAASYCKQSSQVKIKQLTNLYNYTSNRFCEFKSGSLQIAIYVPCTKSDGMAFTLAVSIQFVGCL